MQLEIPLDPSTLIGSACLIRDALLAKDLCHTSLAAEGGADYWQPLQLG